MMRRFGQVASVFVVQALILFVAAGNSGWVWAWVFLGICILSMTVNSFFMYRVNPETIAERSRGAETRGWDRVVGSLWAFSIFLAVPLLAGLDVRFGWSGEPGTAVNIAGAVMLAFGLGLGGWAMISNAFFSTAVRIQTDRGHAVCRSGPYRYVRHPGYVGFILQSVGTPVLLGSLWALIPGFAGAVLLVIRTSLEDQMLQEELSGYTDFVREVRYRLIPGLW